MKVLDYFFAARPLLQLPIWTVYLVALRFSQRPSGGNFTPEDLAVLVGISLLFTGAAYLNQVYDLATDRQNNKVGFLPRGILSPRSLRTGFWVVSIPPVIAEVFISTFAIVLFSQFVLLAWLYSAPPFRLKDRPLWGFFANAYAHGLLVALAVEHQTEFSTLLDVDWSIPVYFALAVGATYILTTIPDREGDRMTGKRTLAVVIGRTYALISTLPLLAAAFILAWYTAQAILAYIALGAAFLVLAALIVRSEAAVRLVTKAPLLVLTIVAGWYYPAYFLFVVALLFTTRAYYRRRFGVIYPELA